MERRSVVIFIIFHRNITYKHEIISIMPDLWLEFETSVVVAPLLGLEEDSLVDTVQWGKETTKILKRFNKKPVINPQKANVFLPCAWRGITPCNHRTWGPAAQKRPHGDRWEGRCTSQQGTAAAAGATSTLGCMRMDTARRWEKWLPFSPPLSGWICIHFGALR